MSKKLLLFFIFVFGLTIFLLAKSWVPAGSILGGHDSGLPLNAWDFFQKRLFAWDNTINFGIDNSAYFGSLTMHGFDLIFATLGGTKFAGNALNVFFWLFLMFLSALALSLELRRVFGKAFTFILPVLLVINFYIFQSIFILERAKYGVYIATLLILTLLLRLKRKKTGVFLTSFLIAILLTVFNGGSWLGVPLFGGFIITIGTFLLTQLFFSVKRKSFKDFWRILSTLALSFIFLIGLSAYSWLPYVSNFLHKDASAVLSQGSAVNNFEWLDNMSQGTSIMNLIRLEGIPDWYQSSNEANPGHQYAGLYINNRFLIVSSFVFPVLALMSLVPISMQKDREKKMIGIFFVILSFIAVIFAAGSRPPTGEIFNLIFTKIPGFAIFRSPYYKFGYSFILGWSVLIAITLSALLEHILHKRVLKKYSTASFIIGLFIINVLVFSYYFPVLNQNKLFQWKSDFMTVFKMPSYIESYINWAKKNNISGKSLLLPPNNAQWYSDGYNFGYWSLSSLLSTASNLQVVSNDTLLNSNESVWVNALYKAIENKNEKGFLFLSNKLNIKYFLVREDVLSPGKWSSPPDFHIYENALNGFTSVSLDHKFDKWLVYKINNIQSTDFSVLNNLTNISDSDFGYIGDFYSFATAFVDKGASNSISSLSCTSCQLEDAANPKNQLNLQDAKILPNSILYRFKKIKREREISHLSNDPFEKITYYLGDMFSLGGEYKTITSFHIADAYEQVVLSNIKNDVETISALVDSIPDSSTNYYLAATIYKYTRPITSQNLTYLRSFPKASSINKDIIQTMQWDINSLNNHFSGLWKNMLSSLNVRSFEFDIANNSSYKLMISKTSVPTLPDRALLTGANGNVTQLSFSDNGSGWYANNSQNFVKGHYTLKLYLAPSINNLPITTPVVFSNDYNGEMFCVGGNIQNFSAKNKYLINLVSNAQELGYLFYRENKDTLPTDFISQNNFLNPYTNKGQNTASYFYDPSSSSIDGAIYLCGIETAARSVESLSVIQLITPRVLLVPDSNTLQANNSSISFTKTSPIEYTVDINNVPSNAVLRFNQRFDSRWTATAVVNGRSVSLDSIHIKIDGYANGWTLPDSSHISLVIKYSPQSKFKLGVIISSVVFIIILLYFAKIMFRKK